MSCSEWSIQAAKNRFSAVIDAAINGVPQRITRRGKRAVVVIGIADYERLQRAEKAAAPTLAGLLLEMPQDDGEIERIPLQPRSINF